VAKVLGDAGMRKAIWRLLNTMLQVQMWAVFFRYCRRLYITGGVKDKVVVAQLLMTKSPRSIDFARSRVKAHSCRCCSYPAPWLEYKRVPKAPVAT